VNEPRRIELATHELRVATSGTGNRHFLCLHGLVDDLEIWSALVPALEDRGRVCRIDQRGHGASEAPPGPYTRADLAKDVVGVLDAEGASRTILVGHSMGGVVAMETALVYPERVAGLVLIGTASECVEKVARWYERIAKAGEERGNDGLREAIYGADSRKEIRGDAQGIAHVTRMLASLYDAPLTPELDRLRCPVLLTVGEKDPMGPKASRILYDALPPGSAALVTVPGRGHWLQLDAPQELVAALDAWLLEFAL